MNGLKLNSIPRNVYAVNSNDTETAGSIKRNSIIASGKMVATEYMGKTLSSRPLSPKFNSLFDGTNLNYATLNRSHWESKLMFCAARSYAVIGKAAPTSFNEVKNDLSLWNDNVFLRTMAEIDREIISPLFFNVIDDISMGMLQMDAVGIGKTKEITIKSNDAFFFEDGSWGSGRSATRNYLYNDTVTITPRPTACNVVINWYQMIANDFDAGWYYGAAVQGMWSKIYAKFIAALTNAASNTKYVPSALQFASYNNDNWVNCTSDVAAANGLSINDLFSFGDRLALSKVVPTDGSGNAMTALQYGIGPEWFRNGLVSMAGGIPLLAAERAIVPGTQNTTITNIFPENKIFIAAKAGRGYKPMYGAYLEGSPIVMTLSPESTANFEININMSAIFDIVPVFASKVGVITVS